MKIKIPYWQIIAIPFLLIAAGTSSNQAVLIANHGKFPVMVNPVQQKEFQQKEQEDIQIGPFRVEMPKSPAVTDSEYLGDDVHTVMGNNSRLKILADIINTHDGVMSVGDVFIMAGTWLWGFAPIVWLTLVLKKVWELTSD